MPEFDQTPDQVMETIGSAHNALIGLWVSGGIALLLVWFVSSFFWRRAPKDSPRRAVLLMISLLAAACFILGAIFFLPSLRL